MKIGKDSLVGIISLFAFFFFSCAPAVAQSFESVFEEFVNQTYETSLSAYQIGIHANNCAPIKNIVREYVATQPKSKDLNSFGEKLQRLLDSCCEQGRKDRHSKSLNYIVNKGYAPILKEWTLDFVLDILTPPPTQKPKTYF